jgi:hypothetical protein
MGKKWWLAIAAILLLAVGLAIGIPALAPPTPGVTYTNYGRLEKRMTRAEVEAILRKPNFGEDDCLWESESGDIVAVTFDENGSLKSWQWNFSSDDRSLVQKLADRIPWFGKPPPQPRSIS